MAVIINKEHILLVIPPLGDVMRNPKDYYARCSWHVIKIT